MTATLGMVGLGRMGGNMTTRLRQAGHTVVGYDAFNADARDVASLDELVAALPAPRTIWVMVPSGAATESTLDALRNLLAPGDVVVDGGNSRYTDSQEQGRLFAELGIGFVDAGVSGGVWGLTEGYCLMVGGSREHVELLQPVFDALAPEGGFVHAGASGAGHFTKMVHNGIEYGLMQAYAEGYELMAASELGIDCPGVMETWRHGSVVRSWLLDLLASSLVADPDLSAIRGYAEDSGEGRWTVNEGVRLAVPLPVITAALFARFASRQDDSPAMKVIASLRNAFGGHVVSKVAGEEVPPEDITGAGAAPAESRPG
ncbi:MAG TPA: decarboxylating 6-phosphogluconate dehydrogenase [Mycobacteriales bacterium]|nr:decarboxylating 6-phosphogluconate dehydrogenase [Mycobacteriales bacterium]